jgi:hypothetical protein
MRAQLLVAAAVLAFSSACAAVGPGPYAGASSDPADPGWRVGGELNAYPAGVVGMVAAAVPIHDDDDLILRLGYNLTERSDFGEHDDESGGGPGVGIGAIHYFADRDEPGWILGTRLDLWRLEIDWENDGDALTPKSSNTTDIFVVQPALETGYVWPSEGGDVYVTLALGVEINVWSDGDDVGEGAILLLGLRLLR